MRKYYFVDFVEKFSRPFNGVVDAGNNYFQVNLKSLIMRSKL